jgi:hypothetical protein
LILDFGASEQKLYDFQHLKHQQSKIVNQKSAIILSFNP